MKSLTLTYLSILLFSTMGIAQTYSFSQTTGTYSELSSSTSLTGNKVWDDPIAVIPIGFNFKYFDTTISTIFLDDWGYGGELSLDTSEIGTYGLLIPYGSDLMDRGFKFVSGGTPTPQSTISYKLEGNTGSRILKIQWKNVGFYSEIEDDDISTDYTNFQLWLYEGSQNIEIHFGENSITQPDLCYDFEAGTYIGLFPKYDFNFDAVAADGQVLSGNPSAPVFSVSNNIYEQYMSATIPNGTIYKFTNTTADITEIKKDMMSLIVTPNPAQNQITIVLEDKKEQVQSVELIDATGKVVLTADNILQPLDISNLSSGFYMINVSSDAHSYTTKLLKK